jgi:hypothetical protein
MTDQPANFYLFSSLMSGARPNHKHVDHKADEAKRDDEKKVAADAWARVIARINSRRTEAQ